MARQSNTPSKSTTKRAAAKRAPEDNTDAAGTVSVGCRLPAGLVVDVAGFGRLAFKGANDRRALALADEQGFHGITTGVSADAWAALEEQYADAKWLTSGAVFAARKVKDVIAEAKEKGDRDVGYNALDPDDLPRDVGAIQSDGDEAPPSKL